MGNGGAALECFLTFSFFFPSSSSTCRLGSCVSLQKARRSPAIKNQAARSITRTCSHRRDRCARHQHVGGSYLPLGASNNNNNIPREYNSSSARLSLKKKMVFRCRWAIILWKKKKFVQYIWSGRHLLPFLRQRSARHLALIRRAQPPVAKNWVKFFLFFFFFPSIEESLGDLEDFGRLLSLISGALEVKGSGAFTVLGGSGQQKRRRVSSLTGGLVLCDAALALLFLSGRPRQSVTSSRPP